MRSEWGDTRSRRSRLRTMNTTPIKGYLVVLKDPLAWATQTENVRNPSYRGVWRIPTWPSRYLEENAPLERLIFEVNDARGCIPTISEAQRLLAELSVSAYSFASVFAPFAASRLSLGCGQPPAPCTVRGRAAAGWLYSSPWRKGRSPLHSAFRISSLNRNAFPPVMSELVKDGHQYLSTYSTTSSVPRK